MPHESNPSDITPSDAAAQPSPSASGLHHLQGGGGDPELADYFREIRENNTRRLRRVTTRRMSKVDTRMLQAPAAAETQDEIDLNAGCNADTRALRGYREATEHLRSASGRRTRIELIERPGGLAELATEDDVTGQRLALHCEQGCSTTGVRVDEARLERPDGAPLVCEREPIDPIGIWSNAEPMPLRAADFAGAFRAPKDLLRAGTSLTVKLRNVVGFLRPFVPVCVKLQFDIGSGASKTQEMMEQTLFVYAEELEPGSDCELTVCTRGWIDLIPVSLSVVESARMLVWLPRPSDEPMPQPTIGHIEAVGRMRAVA